MFCKPQVPLEMFKKSRNATSEAEFRKMFGFKPLTPKRVPSVGMDVI